MEFTRESFLKIAQNNGFSFDGFDSLFYNEEVFEKEASVGNWIVPGAMAGTALGLANRQYGQSPLDAAQSGILGGATTAGVGYLSSRFGKNPLSSLVYGGLGMAGFQKLKEMLRQRGLMSEQDILPTSLVNVLTNRESSGFGAPISYNPMDRGGIY